ncbi:unnamed protein product [Withania somnifera]
MIKFSIGKYHEEILCDVLPMLSCHVLLGRPWKFDRNVTHQGQTNKYTFFMNGKKHVLAPLTPYQDYKDLFPDEIPKGLPPLRGIEHQINFVPGSQIPNRPAYRSNPEEIKELKRQVEELLEKGLIEESLSPCTIPVILVPKKYST